MWISELVRVDISNLTYFFTMVEPLEIIEQAKLLLTQCEQTSLLQEMTELSESQQLALA